MSIRLFKHSFAGGEIAPEMFGRIDDEKFQSGLALCRNFVVKPQGAVENRAGLRLVREAKFADKKVRLIPFVFSTTQTVVIEMGDAYCRFHTQGATLLDDAGQPYEIATPYREDDLFDIHYVQSADIVTLVHPRHAPRELRRYGAADWRLEEIAFSPKLQAPQAAGEAVGGGGIEMRYVVTAAADETESMPSKPVVLSNDLYTSGHRNIIRWQAVAGAKRYKVYKMSGGLYGYIGQTEGLELSDDNISADLALTPPIYDEVFASAGISAVAVDAGGSGYIDKGALAKVDVAEGGALYPAGRRRTGDEFSYGSERCRYAVTGDGSGAVLEVYASLDGQIKEVSVLNGGRAYSHAGLQLQRWIRYRNAWEEYVPPARKPPAGSIFGGSIVYFRHASLQVLIQGAPYLTVRDATGSGAELQPLLKNGVLTGISVVKRGSGYSAPVVEMHADAGSGAVIGKVELNGQDYPAAVSYFQQRRVFAGTHAKPQNIWMTKSGTESNMSYRIPPRDDDRIAVRVAAREANTIRHIVPLNQMILLTSSAEWRMNTVNSEALTPSSVSVAPHSYIGSSNVQPVVVNSTLIYCAARGGHVREMAYNWQAGGYVSGDLSLRSPHLFDGFEITDMAYSKAPAPVVWLVSSSGMLLGNTYIPEQQIGAWHRHDTHKGVFESCAVVAEGSEDVLYCVVRRYLHSGTRCFIERMESRAFRLPEEAFFVDCGLSYHGSATDTVSGLAHLEGETVAVLADGAVLPPVTVSGGKVRLPVAAQTVHVGLPMTADMQTLPVAAQTDGAFGQGRMKNVNKVVLRVWRSSGIWVGPSADQLTEAKLRTDEPYGRAPQPKSGEVEVVIRPAWGDGAQVWVRQSDPLPLTVVGATAEVVLGG